MGFLSDPLVQLILIAVVAVVLLLAFKARKKSAALQTKDDKVDPEIRRLVAAGDYKAAATKEQQAGNLEAALDYFLRAQEIGRAAQLAQRVGKVKQAAELYERDKDFPRAISMYRQAGLEKKAEELEEKVRQTAATAEAAVGLGGTSDRDVATPMERARDAARTFDEALFHANRGDEAAKEKLPELGRAAAEAMLTAGDSRRAAEICRDAGLADQAINLFVNLLGDPGSAAPLLAERGDHKRAAELYEQAGLQQRALDSWISWSDEAPDPLAELAAVDRLGPEATVTLLENLVEKRPAKQSPELHLRIAEAFVERESADRAVAVLDGVPAGTGNEQVQKRIAALRVVAQGRAKAAAKKQPAAAESAEPIPAPRVSPRAEEESSDALPELDLDLDLELPEAAATPAARPRVAKRRAAAPKEDDDGLDLDIDIEQILPATQLEQLVSEVAASAAKEAARLVRNNRPSRPMAPLDVVVDSDQLAAGIAKASKALARGLEPMNLTLELVGDSAVSAARRGPSAEELQEQIGKQSANLQNIEVYYRMGLAHLADGRWQEARSAFSAVEQASPGYRDAWRRVEELEKWKSAVASPTVGVAGMPAEPSGAPQRYELAGELGRGGMAVVYRAHDSALDREVALKFLTPDLTAQPVLVELFQREAKAAAQLNHPNIVTVYDVGTLEGRAFICMELVTGVTVEQLLADSGRLTVLDALRISDHILSALEYAHERQIIHRDIKPSNMMRNELGVVKLMDFGLAKSVGGTDGKKTTMVAGTPGYMAPEQFTGKNVNESSDVFAFGASLYEMLAGRCPFEGMRRDGPPPPLRELNPTVPKLLETLVHRALELDQAQRIATASEMLQPIRKIVGQASTFLNEPARAKVPAAPARVPAAAAATASSEAIRAAMDAGAKGTILGTGHFTSDGKTPDRKTPETPERETPEGAPAAPARAPAAPAVPADLKGTVASRAKPRPAAQKRAPKDKRGAPRRGGFIEKQAPQRTIAGTIDPRREPESPVVSKPAEERLGPSGTIISGVKKNKT